MKQLLLIVALFISFNLSAQSANQNLQVDYVPSQGFEFHLSFDIQFEVKSDFNYFNNAENRPSKTIAITLSETNNWKYLRERSIYHYASKSYTNSDLSLYKSEPYYLYDRFKGAYNNPYLRFNGMVFKVPVLLNNNLMGYTLINAVGGAQFVLGDFWEDKNADHPWITQISQLSLGREWEIVEGPNQTTNSLSYQKDNDAWMYDCELNYIWELLPLAQSAQEAKNQGDVALQKEKIALYWSRSKEVLSQKPAYCKVFRVDEIIYDLGVISNEQSDESVTPKEKNKSEKTEETTPANPITSGTTKEVTVLPNDLAEKTYIERLQAYEKLYAQDFSKISLQSWDLLNSSDAQLKSRFEQIEQQDRANRDWWNSLKISPGLTPENQINQYRQKLQEAAQKYNQDLAQALNLATDFANQNAGQEGALAGALFIVGYGTLSAKSSQKEAEKYLKAQLKANFRQVQKELLKTEEKQLEKATQLAASALNPELENYFVAEMNYWQCRVNGIKNGFSIESTSWVNPSCTHQSKTPPREFNNLSEKELMVVAERKFNATHPTIHQAAYKILEKVISDHPQNAEAPLQYYIWIQKDNYAFLSQHNRPTTGLILKNDNNPTNAVIVHQKAADVFDLKKIEAGSYVEQFCGFDISSIDQIRAILATKKIGQLGQIVYSKDGITTANDFVFAPLTLEQSITASEYLNLGVSKNPNDSKAKELLLYHLACRDKTANSFSYYLQKYPRGIFVNEAQKAKEYFNKIEEVNQLLSQNHGDEAVQLCQKLSTDYRAYFNLQDLEDYERIMQAFAQSEWHQLENQTYVKNDAFDDRKTLKKDWLKSLYIYQVDYQNYLTRLVNSESSAKINKLRNQLSGTNLEFAFGISGYNQGDFSVDDTLIDLYAYNGVTGATAEKVYYKSKQALWNSFFFDMQLSQTLKTFSGPLYLGGNLGFGIAANFNNFVLDEDRNNDRVQDIIESYHDDNPNSGFSAVPPNIRFGLPSYFNAGLNISNILHFDAIAAMNLGNVFLGYVDKEERWNSVDWMGQDGKIFKPGWRAKLNIPLRNSAFFVKYTQINRSKLQWPPIENHGFFSLSDYYNEIEAGFKWKFIQLSMDKVALTPIDYPARMSRIAYNSYALRGEFYNPSFSYFTLKALLTLDYNLVAGFKRFQTSKKMIF